MRAPSDGSLLLPSHHSLCAAADGNPKVQAPVAVPAAAKTLEVALARTGAVERTANEVEGHRLRSFNEGQGPAPVLMKKTTGLALGCGLS